MKPVRYRRFDLVPVPDVNEVYELGFRRGISAPHLRSLQLAVEEHAQFEIAPLRAHEEVAGFAREHDRVMRSVDPLISKRNGSLAQPLPSFLQVLREILRESRLGRRPAVMLLPFSYPLFAVKAFSTNHAQL